MVLRGNGDSCNRQTLLIGKIDDNVWQKEALFLTEEDFLFIRVAEDDAV